MLTIDLIDGGRLSWEALDSAGADANNSASMKLFFGDCVLEPSSRQVWRAGQAVPLTPKMYELLEVLIRRRPAVVTNSELDELLWPKVYVARTSLMRLISELRAALGDTPQDSLIIRTVYKTGYSFCARVESSVDPAAQPSATVQLVWNGRLMPLQDGEHIAGRGAECSLVIDATTVSRRHARITVNAGSVSIEDLDSTNGTHVNGARIASPTMLANGNTIELGSEVLIVKKRDPSALTIRTHHRDSLRDAR